MRIRGLDEETEEAMEDFDLLQGKIADLTKTAKTPGGISLFKDKDKTTYKSTYELLKDIAAIYHDLTDKEQAGLLEALAGKRGGQVLAGILDDFSEVEKAMREIKKSAGSADAEMGIVEESITYKLNALKQTWVGFVQDLIDRGTLGAFIDNLTIISEKLIQLSEAHPVGVLTGIGVAFKTIADILKGSLISKSINNIVSSMETLANIKRGGLFAGLFGGITGPIGKAVDELKAVSNVTKEVIEDADDLGKAALEEANGVAKMGEAAKVTSGATSGLAGTLATVVPPLLITVAVIGAVVAAWDYYTTTVKEAEKDVEKTTGKINQLQAEIKELESIDYRNSAQQEKLDSLNQELSIQEQILEIEKKRAALERHGTKFSDKFDTDNLNTKYDTETSTQNRGSGRNLALAYKDRENDVKNYEAKIAARTKEIEEYTNKIYEMRRKIQSGDITESAGTQKIAEYQEQILKIEQWREREQNKLNKYNEAQLETQTQLAEKALEYQSYINQIDEDIKDAEENPDQYSNSYIHNLQEERKKWQGLLDEVNAVRNVNPLSEKDYSSTIESVFQHAGFGDKKDALIEMGKNETLSVAVLEKQFGSLVDEMNEAGVSAEVLYNWIMNLANPLSNQKRKFAEQVGGALKDQYNIYGDVAKNSEYLNKKAIRDYLDGLSEEEFEIISGLEIDWSTFDADEAIARMNQALEEAGPAEVGIDVESDIITSVSNINTKLKPQFDELASAYNAIFNGDNGFDLEVVDVNLMEGIRKTFRELGDDIGVSFEDGDRAVNQFLDTITSAETKSKSLSEQQQITQQAFNDLATSYFYSAEGLKDLNDETADAIDQQLEQLGITNSTEIVTQALADAKAVEAAQTALAAGKSYEDVNALLTEANASEYARIAAFQLAVQEQILSNTELNFSDKIKAINDLAGAYLTAANAAKVAAYSAQLESKIKVGDINGDPNQMLNDYIAGLQTSLDVEKLKVNVEWPGGGSSAKDAGSAAGKDFKSGFDEELSKLKDSYDRGEITLAQYLAAYRALIDKYFDDTEKNAEDRAKALHDYLVEMKGYYDSAISGVTTLIDYRIKAVQKQKDAAIKALEEERDAALKVYDDQIKAIDKTIKAKQKQIKALEKAKKPLQDEIDAIRKANEERQREIDLQKDLYELERLQNQRTQFIYKDNQLVYQNDPSAIRDQRERVKQDEDEKKIAELEKQIEAYDKQIELINEEIESLEEQKELLEEQRAAVEEFYNKLIEDTQKYFDELIEALEKQKSKWEELAEVEKITSAWKDVGEVMEMFGYTVEDVLNDTPGAFETFKDAYLQMCLDVDNGNKFTMQGIQEWANQTGQSANVAAGAMSQAATDINGSTDAIADGLDKAKDSADKTADSLSNVGSSTSGYGGAASDVNAVGDASEATAGKVDDLTQKTEKLEESANDATTLKSAFDELQGINLDNIMSQLEALRQKLTEIKTAIGLVETGSNGEQALGGLGSITGALQSLNDISLEGVIAQFTSLKGAIDGVVAALGGGEGGAPATNGGVPGTGAQSAGNMGQQTGSSSGGLVGAIEGVKTAADTYIGTSAGGGEGSEGGEGEGGGTAIADFEALKTSVDGVTTAIGSGGGENAEGGAEGGAEGEGGNTLISAITAFGETDAEVMGEAGEDGGEGVLGRWASFNEEIDTAKTAINEVKDAIDNLPETKEVTVTVHLDIDEGHFTGSYTGTATNGKKGRGFYTIDLWSVLGVPADKAGTYNSTLKGLSGKAKLSGTALLNGDWAYEGGKTLIAEIGPELVVFPNGTFRTFDYPQMVDLPRGSVIFNHKQTDEILDKKNQVKSLTGKSNLNGTLPSNFTPLSQSNPEAFNTLVQNAELLRVNTEDMKTDLSNIGYATDDIKRAVQNITNNTNMGVTITFGDLQFTCTGITSAEVFNEVGNALQQEFQGLALNAYQRAVNMA